MDKNILSVREIAEKDIAHIANYWFASLPEYLRQMGVDTGRLPSREQYEDTLEAQIRMPYPEKKAYCIIWEENHKAIGHSNINPFTFGKEGNMHLHIWDGAGRNKGYGPELIRLTLPYFFHNLELQKIYCEPYALNPSPHKALEKAGFRFVKDYVTTPGSITFEQPVKLWEMDKKDLNG